MKYWVAATGRNNWSPHSDARICGLHFVKNDYYNDINKAQKRFLKPDVIPTQHVHTTILQIFEQDTADKISECKFI
ncbi:hypothetical protein ALC62_01536 [Cyphomyrmex costatus]|uniref:THAP-type domain-containing protein n=1 Tax=Cyphomyrmex costatus TaxID=456900 RepID=A0A195D4H9_9HYME|nr:hypothetical protein ALC62_01536 [Cyphomyrmex costatus]